MIKRRTLSLLLALALIFSCLPQLSLTAFAADAHGTCGKDLEWKFDESSGMLTILGTGDMELYDGDDAPWDSIRGKITSVIVDDGVTSISNYAFSDCPLLNSVTIHSDVQSIGGNTFSGCEQLRTVELDTEIVEDWFCNNPWIETVDIGPNTGEIGDKAFAYCSNLKRVSISDGVRVIGERAFLECENLSELYLGKGLETIGPFAFQYCESLKKLRLPDGLKEMGEYAFASTQIGSVVIPDGVTEISSGLFSGCRLLTSVTLHDRMTGIGVSAFHSCTGLRSIDLPKSVKAIEDGAFGECTSLTRIVLPPVKSVNMYCFEDCTALKEVTLPEGLEMIQTGAFEGCTSLKSISLPMSTKYIGSRSFWKTGLAEIIIPYHVKHIDGIPFHIKQPESGEIDFTIYGYENSYGQEYAASIEVPFVALDGTIEAFLDVPKECFYRQALGWALEENVTNGVSPDSFAPNRACTRAQVATFLWRAAGSPEPESTEMPFVDVKTGSFYEKAVAWAVENGITNGVDRTHFGPDKTCTRGQVVTFLWRAAGCPEPENTESAFRDLKKGGFYLDAVAWAVENEVTNGLSADTFGPDANCTRAQVVTFLHRAKNIPGPEVVIPEPELTEVNAFLIWGASDGLSVWSKVKVSSKKELRKYLDSCFLNNYVRGFDIEKYTDAYFANNDLLFMPLNICGSLPEYSIESVSETEDKISVELFRPYGIETDDMCAWILVLETAKSKSDRTVSVTKNLALAVDTSWYNEEDDTFTISTDRQLAGLAQIVNSGTDFSGKTVQLENSICLSDHYTFWNDGAGWIPIGQKDAPFRGHFDGNNKTISDLHISDGELEYAGLFGYIDGGKVENLRLTEVSVSGKDHVGGIVGSMNTLDWSPEDPSVDCAAVKNCFVTGEIEGKSFAGGIAGDLSCGYINDCYSGASVTGGNYMGGIVGAAGLCGIENCYSTGQISGKICVGGIAGEFGGGSLYTCYATGKISGTESVGGIAGQHSAVELSIIRDCAALNDSVSGTKDVGRISGVNREGSQSNNCALDCMDISEGGTEKTTLLNTHDQIDGADISMEDAKKAAFWTESMGFNAAVFAIADGSYPILSSLNLFE